jgi:DNA-binding response OmpR family regulator
MAHSILLIEDDADLREVMAAFLESQDFDVACAENGAEALRLLWRGLHPCAILLDLMLPGLDGFAFREFQRANPAWVHIPVIVVSAMDDLSQRIQELRPAAWFKKPVDLDALATAITRYC